MNDEKMAEEKGEEQQIESRDMGGSGGGTRTLILGVLLLGVVGAACYEFLIVRPAFEKASTTLESMQILAKDENGELLKTDDGRSIRMGDVDKDGQITPEDVHKTLDMQPSEKVDVTETGFYETYKWQGITSRKMYVLYNKMSEEKSAQLYSIKNKTPTKEMFRTSTVSDPNAPAPSAGGGLPPSSDKKDDKGKEKSDQKTKETSGDGKTESGSAKKADAKVEEKKADAKVEEKVEGDATAGKKKGDGSSDK